MIGPDKVIANASSSKSEYSSPFGKSPTLLLSLDVVYTEPWNSFVPALVTAVIVPPVALPFETS